MYKHVHQCHHWAVTIQGLKNTIAIDHYNLASTFLFLSYRADTQTYQPYNKDWIKEKIYVLLRRQAQQAGK